MAENWVTQLIQQGQHRCVEPQKIEFLYPTSNTSNTGKPEMFREKWVADLAVANPIGNKLRAVFAHEDLVHQLRRSRAIFKSVLDDEANDEIYHNETNDSKKKKKEKYYTRKLEKLWSKIVNLENQIATIDGNKKQTRKRRPNKNVQTKYHHRRGVKIYNPDDVLRAYVTFNNRESFRRCIDDYSSTSWYNLKFQEKEHFLN